MTLNGKSIVKALVENSSEWGETFIFIWNEKTPYTRF